jgi:Flp pilus assembly protein CpaB
MTTSSTSPLAGARLRLRALRRAVLVRRRPLAALCAAVAVLAGLRVTAAPPPVTEAVPVAARDLPAGLPLGASDVETAHFPTGTAPAGVADDAVGRVLASPLRAGEPVTDVRLAGPSLVATHPGLAALPVRLPDAGVVSLLRAGDEVDLLATDPAAGTSSVLATEVLVLAVPAAEAAGGPTGAPAAGALSGRLVVVGVPPHQLEEVTAASVSQFLTVAFTP